MNEIWKDIKGQEGRYLISNIGRVKTFVQACKSNKDGILKNGVDTGGYFIIKLYTNGKGTTTKIHRLVAETFIENPNNLPQVNHKDGNKQNNNVDNLEWCTPLENAKHSWDIGLSKKYFGEQTSQAKFTEKQILEIRNKFPNQRVKDLAKEYGMSTTNVSDIVNRKIWTHI